MKYVAITLILTIMVISGVMILSCGTSTNPVISHEFPNPVDSVATNITLIVYSDGFGTVLDTILLTTEGAVTIDITEAHPYYDPPQYYIYAVSDGFYTELYKCKKGETIDVDLDAVPYVSNSVTGTIFASQTYFADCYLSDYQISLTLVGGNISFTSKTDAQGRFGFSGLQEGDYLLHFSYMGLPFSFNVSSSPETDYSEFTFLEPVQEMAPNIYLYPESTTQVQIEISFPDVGEIILSEPEYNDGWDVSVTEDGIIDGQYDYLFYEAMLPQPNNQERGWLIARSDLESKFRSILTDYGCVGREIDDFIEFWVPRLDYAPWFAVYPQDVETMMHLNITPQPDTMLRLHFCIRGVNQEIPIIQPSTPEKFIRDKFTVVEWGAFELK